MIRISIYPFLVLILLFLLPSCVEEINLDAGGERPVVVECILEKQPVQTLKLFRLLRLSESEPQAITQAKAYILKEGERGTFTDTVTRFKWKNGVEWEAEFEPEYGVSYQLLVEVSGEKDIVAETKFPDDLRLCRVYKELFFSLDSISHAITYEVKEGSYETKYYYYTFDDSIAIGQSFASLISETPVKVYDKTYNKACKYWVFPLEDTVAVKDLPANYFRTHIEEISFNGTGKGYARYSVTDHPGADSFNLVSGTVTDLDFVRHPHFFWGLVSYTFDKEGNIIPIEYAKRDLSQWIKTLCPYLPLHKGFLRIAHPDHFNNGQSEEDLLSSSGKSSTYQYSDHSFFICADYQGGYGTKAPGSKGKSPVQMLEVWFVSDEYDAFLRGLYVRRMNEDNFLLSQYDYDSIYTNVDGGCGIFGAKLATWDIDAVWRDTYTVIVDQN